MSKERVGYITGLLGYTKVCSRWVPRMLMPEKKQNMLKFVKNFWSAIMKREINFFWILLLGMSHGFIILTLKKNEWAWNTGTLHLLARKNSKQCRLPTRFFWLCFGTHKEFTWQNFWKLGRLSIQLGTLKQQKTYGGRCVKLGGQHRGFCCCMTMQDRTLLAQWLMLWRRWSLRFSPFRPTALTWRQAISISFLTSRGISRGLISPHMMKWSKLWRRGSNKELLNSSLTACVSLFYVGKNVLNDKATVSKNKYVNL